MSKPIINIHASLKANSGHDVCPGHFIAKNSFLDDAPIAVVANFKKKLHIRGRYFSNSISRRGEEEGAARVSNARNEQTPLVRLAASQVE